MIFKVTANVLFSKINEIYRQIEKIINRMSLRPDKVYISDPH